MFFEKMMNAYWSKKAGNRKGFTLVEMLVVIAIIAALSSVIIPTIGTSLTKSAAATNASNLRNAKGEFTTMKLMYPDDYKSWTGGRVALTGVTAENEQFIVSGDPNAGKAKAATPLTVTAKNAVEMKTEDTTVLKGTPMNAQIIRNSDGVEEVYVTYNGLPIAYFAEVAEKGTADAAYYRTGAGNKGAGNLEANKAYIDKYVGRANTVIEALKDAPGSSLLFGNLVTQMGNIATDVDGQGDCMQCAMNKLDTSNMGILGAVAGDKVTNKLTSMGYQPNGNKYCAAYSPVNGKDGACTCDPTHGQEAHISTTSKVGIGEGYEACPKGGLHDYQYQSHVCIKCGYKLEKACPTVDTSIPYLGQMLDGECMYCGYCSCCAAADTSDSAQWVEVGAGNGDHTRHKEGGFLGIGGKWVYTNVGAGNGDYALLSGYDIANVKGVDYNTGVCMSADPLLGGKGKGCGHTAADHLRTFPNK